MAGMMSGATEGNGHMRVASSAADATAALRAGDAALRLLPQLLQAEDEWTAQRAQRELAASPALVHSGCSHVGALLLSLSEACVAVGMAFAESSEEELCSDDRDREAAGRAVAAAAVQAASQLLLTTCRAAHWGPSAAARSRQDWLQLLCSPGFCTARSSPRHTATAACGHVRTTW
ncbi:hypothetical protein ABPG75_004935 [Micractinium tetrahymenae]